MQNLTAKSLSIFAVLASSLLILSCQSPDLQQYASADKIREYARQVASQSDATGQAAKAASDLAFNTALTAAVNEPLENRKDFLGHPVDIDSTLRLSDGAKLSGDLDAIIPLGVSGADNVLSDQENRQWAVFLQPGLSIWRSSFEQTRYDFNIGLVSRFRIRELENSLIGVGGFFDINANNGTNRFGLGADWQYLGWYSSLNYYKRLSGWKRSSQGFDERALNGLSARFELPVLEQVKLGFDANRWWGGEFSDAVREQLGASVIYDITDWLRFEVGTQRETGGKQRFSAEFNVRPFGENFLGDKSGGDFYRRFDREKRIFVERRQNARVRLSLAQTAAVEGAAPTLFITLEEPAGYPVSATLVFTGSANADDFQLDEGITIRAGSSSVSIPVTLTDDDLFEGDETLIIAIATVAGGIDVSTPQTLTIQDNESPPTPAFATLASPNVTEAQGSVSITANLNGPAADDRVIDLAFDGTATREEDYSVASASIMIPAGEISGSLLITLIEDNVFEGDETIIISFGNNLTAQKSVAGLKKASAAGNDSITITIEENGSPPVLTLALDADSIPEMDGVATLSASLSHPTVLPVSVVLAIGGTATGNGTDYSLPENTISILPEALAGSLVLTTNDDEIFEGDETLHISAASVNNATDASTLQTLTITDDETAPAANPVLSLTVDAAIISETGGIATITASLDVPASEDVTVAFGLAGTATGGADYTASATNITIPAGGITGTLTLSSQDDTIFEGDETVSVSIASLTAATDVSTPQTITIADDETQPNLTLAVDQNVIAENGGVAVVTASLSGPAGTDIIVTFGLAGSAAEGPDYSLTPSPLTIPAGSITAQATLSATDDPAFEGDETVNLSVAAAPGATDVSTPQTITIADDETQPNLTLSVDQNVIAENGGVAILTANLSGPSATDVTVNLAFGGTAIGSGTDYSTSATTVTIPAGQTNGAVTVNAIDDGIFENAETVIASVLNVAGATDVSTPQTITIADDETQPNLTLAVDQNVIAENGGVAVVTASLDLIFSSNVTATLNLTGTATGGGTDYTLSTVNILIPAGSTSDTVTITAQDDTIFEGDETVIVTATAVTGATDASSPQTITILENDPLPSASFTVSAGSFSEEGGAVQFNVTLSHPSTQTVTVPIAIGHSNGAAPGDYSLSASSVILSPGQTAGALTITGISDTNYENLNETLTLSIGAGIVNAIDAGTPANVDIIDNDLDPGVTCANGGTPFRDTTQQLSTKCNCPANFRGDFCEIPSFNSPALSSLVLSSGSMSENGGMVTLTANLNKITTGSVTATFGFTGTAIKDTDYVASSISITIPNGSSSGTLTITGLDDMLTEGSETATFTVSAYNGGTNNSNPETLTITDDD